VNKDQRESRVSLDKREDKVNLVSKGSEGRRETLVKKAVKVLLDLKDPLAIQEYKHPLYNFNRFQAQDRFQAPDKFQVPDRLRAQVSK
jgi:hypothetical protein